MSALFRRRRHDPHVIDALRRSLDARAAEAPAGEQFAEQVFAALDRPVADPHTDEPRPARRRVLVPVLAAAAVLAVVAGVVLAVTQLRDSGGNGHPNEVANGTNGTRHVTPTSPPSTVTTPATTTPAVSSTPSANADSTVKLSQLSRVSVVDLTFTGADDGWALASADCLRTSGRCTALLRTTDGATWKSHPNTPFNVPGVNGCAAPCVQHLRFANDDTGYAFGPSAFFMTTDGGANWTRQAGGAVGLETADGDVVRVVSSGSGCPGPCGLAVETSDIGSTHWAKRNLGRAAQAAADSASLVRSGSDVYLLVSGGERAARPATVLYRSADDGASWRHTANPCATAGAVRDTIAVAAGSDGRVGVLCRVAQTAEAVLGTSSDAGVTFTARAAAPQRAGLLAVGGTGVYLQALDTLSRTGNSGTTWTTATRIEPGFVWLGFESDDVARLVADGGRVIWTTRDGGLHWTSVRFE